MRIIISVLLGLLGGLLWVGSVHAHAAYLRSNPGAEAVVAVPPERVEIWFKQELFRRKGENTITVTDADGNQVSAGDTVIDDDNRTHIWVALQPNLAPGVYFVAWKNLSLDDGHPADGTFPFTIDPQAKETSTPMGAVVPTNAETLSVTATSNPSPTETLPVKSTPDGGLPCAASFVPLFVLGGLVLNRSRNRP